MNIKKMQVDNKRNWIIKILVFCICFAVSFSFVGKSLYEDNYNYAIEEMHAFDNTLYANNINNAGAECSPRLYANMFMSLIMTVFHIEWATAAMYLVRINYLLYTIAAFLFCITFFKEKKQRLLGAVVVSVCGLTPTLKSIAFPINGAEDVFLGTAIPIVMIAVIFACNKKSNWDLIWILMMVAEFMHVHEGIWGGVIVSLIWLAGCIADKKINWRQLRMLPVFIISLFLVVVPSLLCSETIDQDLFTQIYVFIRTPHHLLVSDWGIINVIYSLLLILGAFACLYIYQKKYKKNIDKLVWGLAFLIIFWILSIIVEYFCTEVFSISIIPTMYIPKYFKYVTWIAALVYTYFGITAIIKKKYLSAFCLLTILLLPYNKIGDVKIQIGAFILLFGFLVFSCKMDIDDKLFMIEDEDDSIELLVVLAFMTLIILNNEVNYVLLAVTILLLFVCYVEPKIKLRILARLCTIISFGFVLVLSIYHFALYRDNGLHVVTSQKYIEDSVGSNIYELAIQFENMTDKDTMFLGNPDSLASNGFQLVSHRSCYALYKNTPSSKGAVIEWYTRIENTRPMTYCSVDDLVDMLKDIDLEYVLVTSDRFGELDNSDLFCRIIGNDSYGVYRLIP